MPFAVANSTVTGWPLGAVRLTVRFAFGPLSETVRSLTESSGMSSSSVIVPTAWLSEIVAFVAFDRLTKKVSCTSLSSSPCTVTLTVFVVSPAANVSGPLAAV